jgi:micrococcal nuclease
MENRPSHQWVWKGKVVRWIDGDTVIIEFDCGFRTKRTEVCRLIGINTPEIRGEEHEFGMKALAKVVELCPFGSEVVVRSHKNENDKYGRWLVEVWPTGNYNADVRGIDSASVNLILLANNLAIEY